MGFEITDLGVEINGVSELILIGDSATADSTIANSNPSGVPPSDPTSAVEKIFHECMI